MQARSTVQNIRLGAIQINQPNKFPTGSTNVNPAPASQLPPGYSNPAPVASTSQVEPQMLQTTTAPPASTTQVTPPKGGSLDLPFVVIKQDPATGVITRESTLPKSDDSGWNILPAGEGNSLLIWLAVGAAGLYIANKKGLLKTTKRRRR